MHDKGFGLQHTQMRKDESFFQFLQKLSLQEQRDPRQLITVALDDSMGKRPRNPREFS